MKPDKDPLETPTPQAAQRVQLEITWKSILRCLLGALLTYAAIRLWPVFKLLILAILVAVALYPIVLWVRRKGWPDWVGLCLAMAMLLVLVVGCFAVIAPLVVQQMSTLGDSLPRLREQIVAHLPPSGPVHDVLQQGITTATAPDSKLMLERMLLLVETTVGGLVRLVVVVALAVYLMLDGPRALKWLILFFPRTEREKISQALGQVSDLIFSYVVGQFFISALAGTYLFVLLKVLHVDMALLLGLVAGICDFLPIIGFFIAVFMAMAIGLTVSPMTAVLIFVLYGAYHLFENFFIIPRVYGKRLKLAKLVVPLAVVGGGMVAGVVGAIAVLPIVASYPVIERLWLARKLEPDVVKAHEE